MSWPRVTTLRLAVEVLSPSSVRTDRVEKRDHYLDASVDEYWVVDGDTCMVERWFKRSETPQVARGELVWHPDERRIPLVIDLPRTFAAIAARSLKPDRS
jgi:Uma2 family endonuclease